MASTASRFGKKLVKSFLPLRSSDPLYKVSANHPGLCEYDAYPDSGSIMVAFNKITGLMVAAFAAGVVANPMGWPKFGKDLHVRVYRYESNDCTGPFQGDKFPEDHFAVLCNDLLTCFLYP
ncbi:hypothetical protein KC336_g20881 [Hortaea werneckii]|nr:hypothetical protein KC336_g20881 [Hortaea werneckii]